MLPQLLNELGAKESEVVLVLDDYHLVTNRVCHDSLGFFVDHLPANVHLMVATRVDPPLPLARLRAGGELTELRIVDLGFTDAEATTLWNQSMGPELTAQQTQRLWEWTEGWAAGLVLAGLSLRGRADPGPFIALFAQLLSLQLAEQEPEMVPVLHRRAAAWYQHAGDVEAAIDHAASAGEFAHAGALIARHWLLYAQRGRVTTVQRWLDLLPDDFITANPPLALLAAWVGGLCDVPRREIERRLATAEASDYQGPLPAGLHSVPFAAALVRAVNTFDVTRSLRAARQAVRPPTRDPRGRTGWEPPRSDAACTCPGRPPRHRRCWRTSRAMGRRQTGSRSW